MRPVFILLAFLACLRPLSHGADAKPNIVYILCDDLGYGDVHCLNPQRCKIATPNMDKLAAAGMMFTEAHSSSAVCSPTRYGILTGRYNWRSPLQKGVLSGYSPPLIAAESVDGAWFLKQHGYDTAIIGKWHLGLGLKQKAPEDSSSTGRLVLGLINLRHQRIAGHAALCVHRK